MLFQTFNTMLVFCKWNWKWGLEMAMCVFLNWMKWKFIFFIKKHFYYIFLFFLLSLLSTFFSLFLYFFPSFSSLFLSFSFSPSPSPSSHSIGFFKKIFIKFFFKKNSQRRSPLPILSRSLKQQHTTASSTQHKTTTTTHNSNNQIEIESIS